MTWASGIRNLILNFGDAECSGYTSNASTTRTYNKGSNNENNDCPSFWPNSIKRRRPIDARKLEVLKKFEDLKGKLKVREQFKVFGEG